MADVRDRLHLTLIAEALSDISRRLSSREYAAFIADRDEQALTAFRLSIIGENAHKLSEALKARHPHLPWADMYVFRNIVSHEYHSIDAELTWEAVHRLDEIAIMIERELG